MNFDPENTGEIPTPISGAAASIDASDSEMPAVVNATDQNGDSSAEPLHVLQEVSKAAAAFANDAAANVSKAELANVLEGFARVLRADPNHQSVSLVDHMAEVAQLKALLMEAQETIINLLNDRVYDRAKLARLEAEVRFLPDLQAQANRAMNLAQHSEDVQNELAHVRAEVERLRTSYMRSEKSSSGWFERLFKRP